MFFISLVPPTAHITKEKIATSEQRYLSKYVPLFDAKNRQFNLNYGNDLENYLKDRFWGRMNAIHFEKLISYYSSSRYVKFGEITIDKQKKIIYDHLIAGKPNAGSQRQITEGLKAFNEYCKKNHIKFYPAIMPRKESIYIPDLVTKDKNDELREVMNYVSEQSGTKIIFPLDNLLKAKEKSPYLLYHKTDHHATIDGAYIGYNVLISEIKKDFPEIKSVTPSDLNYSFNRKVNNEGGLGFRNGVTCSSAGIPDSLCEQFLDVDFRYAKHKNVDNLHITETRTDDIIKKDYFYSDGADLKVMVFGDSYTPNLLEFLPYSFKKVRYIRVNGPRKIERSERMKLLKYYKNEIQDFQPDILIFCLFYSEFGRLKDVAEKE